MLFSEIYSAYYQAAAGLINAAISGELTAKNAEELIASRAFRESFVYILDAIRREDWKIITRDFRTSLRYPPQTPLTTLELRWTEWSRFLHRRIFISSTSSATGTPIRMLPIGIISARCGRR